MRTFIDSLEKNEKTSKHVHLRKNTYNYGIKNRRVGSFVSNKCYNSWKTKIVKTLIVFSSDENIFSHDDGHKIIRNGEDCD